jgi:hypothetical protein
LILFTITIFLHISYLHENLKIHRNNCL